MVATNPDALAIPTQVTPIPAPAPTTRPKKASTLMAWKRRERRRIMLLSAVATFAVTLPRGSAARRLVLSAPGYQRAVAEVTPDVDSRLYFELARAPRTARRR